MASVLVTGGAGFIGSHLAEVLVRRDFDVRVLDDFSSGRRANLKPIEDRIELFEGSILDDGLVDRATEGASCVFHLAAIVSVERSVQDPEGTRRINVDGTSNVIRAALRAQAKLIFSSSAAVYGASAEAQVPQSEALEPRPISPYGEQKLEGEALLTSAAQHSGLNGVSLRYFNVYGTRQDPSSPYSGVISLFGERIPKGLAIGITGDGEQTRDFVFVSDVVHANLLAMGAQNMGAAAVNVGTGIETSIHQLAESLFALCGRRTDVERLPERTGEIRRSVADTSLAERTLGFRAQVDLVEGLKRTLETQKAG